MQPFGLIPNIVVDGNELAPGAAPLPAALTSKTNYEAGVLTMLTGLIRTWTGWAVMTEVFGKQKKMFIRPYHATPQDPFNAYAGALDPQAATMQGTPVGGGQGWGSATKGSKVVTGSLFYQGYRIKIQGTDHGRPYSANFRYQFNSPTQVTLTAYSTTSFGDNSDDVKWEGDTGSITWAIEGSPTQAPVIGTGTGSDTQIRFSPDTFAAPGAPTGPGAKADEILLHEMVHGLRQMVGRAVFEQVTGNPGMQNYEEFAAIVISNVYRSERGITELRRDHIGFSPLTGPETAAATFKTTYQSYLLDMDTEQPKLCQNLRKVVCVFNPFV